jgi:hypothetical protein
MLSLKTIFQSAQTAIGIGLNPSDAGQKSG